MTDEDLVNKLSSAWAVWPPTHHPWGLAQLLTHWALEPWVPWSIWDLLWSWQLQPMTHIIQHISNSTRPLRRQRPQFCFGCHRHPAMPPAAITRVCKSPAGPLFASPKQMSQIQPQMVPGTHVKATVLRTFTFHLWYFCQPNLLLVPSFVVSSCK